MNLYTSCVSQNGDSDGDSDTCHASMLNALSTVSSCHARPAVAESLIQPQMEDGTPALSDRPYIVVQVKVPKIPEHLECPGEVSVKRFDRCPESLLRFYNCARTWCVQAGILDGGALDSDIDKGKHVKKLTVFMNRMLGINLEQQSILFKCASAWTGSCLDLVARSGPCMHFVFFWALCARVHASCGIVPGRCSGRSEEH